MLGIFGNLPIKHSVRWCTILFMHQNIVRHQSCVSYFTPAISFLCCEPCKVHHCPDSSNRSWKGSLYICILLKVPCCCVFKDDAQSFCITLLFKFLILPSIVTLYLLHLNLVLILKPIQPRTNHINLV